LLQLLLSCYIQLAPASSSDLNLGRWIHGDQHSKAEVPPGKQPSAGGLLGCRRSKRRPLPPWLAGPPELEIFAFCIALNPCGRANFEPIRAGASSGLGLETARVLALRGVHVVMAVRNVSAGLAAKEAIAAKIPGARIDVLEVDLSSMASVRRFAAEFGSLNLPLNILM
jgi:hypothetical protein